MTSLSLCTKIVWLVEVEKFDGLIFDNDSYLNYLEMTDTREALIRAKRWMLPPDSQARTEQIYFVLRSVMTIGRDATEETLKELKEWRRMCARNAEILQMLPEFHENPPLPTWATGAVDQVRQQLRPKFPNVDEITVKATLDPRLYVRSYQANNQIQISVLFRELLRTINLGIWNAIVAPDSWRELRDGRLPEDCFLPYFLPLYWNIPWSRIPTMRANSKHAAMLAINCVRLQMTFMIAHEFAHLLLHEAGRSGPELEAEADRFAYEVLFRDPGENASVGDVWMSSRWLFEILALERTISWRLSGNDGMPLTGDHRRETLLFPFARAAGPSMVDVNLGGRGLIWLSNTRAAIADLTPVALRQRAQQWSTEMMAG